jgi:DNA primase
MSLENNTGLCPFHEDTDPSFHMWKKKDIFHCFGCGFGGDVVKTHNQLRRQYFGENLSVEKTINQLAQIFDIELDIDDGFTVLSVFERARMLMLDKNTYNIPKDVMSIAEFRQLNNKVRRSSVPIKAKIANFEHLDLIAAITLSNQEQEET